MASRTFFISLSDAQSTRPVVAEAAAANRSVFLFEPEKLQTEDVTNTYINIELSHNNSK